MKAFKYNLLLISLLISINCFSEDSIEKIPLAIVVNDIYHADIESYINITGFTLEGIHRRQLSEILQEYMSEDMILSITLSDDELITSEELGSIGIETDYDYSSLSITIDIPPQLQKIKKLSIIKPVTSSNINPIATQNLSFYLNIFGNQNISTVIDVDTINSYTGSYTFDGSLNIKKWVLTTKVDYNTYSGADLPDMTLNHDFRNLNLRMKLGSYTADITGFQKSGKYQGLSIRHYDFDLNNISSQVSSDILVLIDNESTVEIWMNGRLIRTLNLSPGYYNLNNLPFYNGLNNIEVRVRPKTGDQTTLIFNFSQYVKNLQKGKHDFAYSTGFPSWEPNSFLISGYHYYGLLNSLTLGGNVQVTDSDLLFGQTTLYSTPVGNFLLENALYLNDFIEFITGYGGLLSYRYVNNSNHWLPIFGLNFGYNSYNFHHPNVLNPIEYDISGSVSQKITTGFNGNLGLSYQTYHNTLEPDLTLNFKLNYVFTSKVVINLSLRTSLSNPELENSSLVLLFHYPGTKNGNTVNYSYNAVTTRHRVDWQYTVPDSNLGLSSSYESPSVYDDVEHLLNTSAIYNSERFTSSALFAYSKTTQNTSYNNSLNIATAIAYSNGYVAVTKPISDSFAIIVPRYNLLDKEIGINYDGKKYESKSNFFGPAVLSNLGSYKVKTITVDLQNPTSDIFIVENDFVLFPDYRSGTIVYVGKEPEVIVSASITTIENDPLPYLNGYISYKGEEILFFTDKDSRTVIYGLSPGKYILSIENFEPYELIVIPEKDQNHMYSDIKLKPIEGADN